MLKFLFAVFLLFNSLVASQIVYIYAGPGIAKKSLLQTETTLKFFLKDHYQVERIHPEQIINEDWEKKAALLVMPGGADIPYDRALNGIGNQKIRSYVENGGAYLGICAGSYYAGSFVDFAKGTDLEVQEKRELSFFPGVVKGPILAPYDYLGEKGARAAKVTWVEDEGFEKNTVFTIYYNGGGYFVDADQKKGVKILGCYEGNLPAIIECEVGQGKAILSGVHFEHNPFLLDESDEDLKSILPELKEQNNLRIQLVKYILSILLSKKPKYDVDYNG